MPRSHIHGSPRRFNYGLNLTDDPGNANFRSPIRMHFIRTLTPTYLYCEFAFRAHFQCVVRTYDLKCVENVNQLVSTHGKIMNIHMRLEALVR